MQSCHEGNTANNVVAQGPTAAFTEANSPLWDLLALGAVYDEGSVENVAFNNIICYLSPHAIAGLRITATALKRMDKARLSPHHFASILCTAVKWVDKTLLQRLDTTPMYHAGAAWVPGLYKFVQGVSLELSYSPSQTNNLSSKAKEQCFLQTCFKIVETEPYRRLINPTWFYCDHEYINRRHVSFWDMQEGLERIIVLNFIALLCSRGLPLSSQIIKIFLYAVPCIIKKGETQELALLTQMLNTSSRTFQFEFTWEMIERLLLHGRDRPSHPEDLPEAKAEILTLMLDKSKNVRLSLKQLEAIISLDYPGKESLLLLIIDSVLKRCKDINPNDLLRVFSVQVSRVLPGAVSRYLDLIAFILEESSAKAYALLFAISTEHSHERLLKTLIGLPADRWQGPWWPPRALKASLILSILNGSVDVFNLILKTDMLWRDVEPREKEVDRLWLDNLLRSSAPIDKKEEFLRLFFKMHRDYFSTDSTLVTIKNGSPCWTLFNVALQMIISPPSEAAAENPPFGNSANISEYPWVNQDRFDELVRLGFVDTCLLLLPHVPHVTNEKGAQRRLLKARRLVIKPDLFNLVLDTSFSNIRFVYGFMGVGIALDKDCTEGLRLNSTQQPKIKCHRQQILKGCSEYTNTASLLIRALNEKCWKSLAFFLCMGAASAPIIHWQPKKEGKWWNAIEPQIVLEQLVSESWDDDVLDAVHALIATKSAAKQLTDKGIGALLAKIQGYSGVNIKAKQILTLILERPYLINKVERGSIDISSDIILGVTRSFESKYDSRLFYLLLTLNEKYFASRKLFKASIEQMKNFSRFVTAQSSCYLYPWSADRYLQKLLSSDNAKIRLPDNWLDKNLVYWALGYSNDPETIRIMFGSDKRRYRRPHITRYRHPDVKRLDSNAVSQRLSASSMIGLASLAEGSFVDKQLRLPITIDKLKGIPLEYWVKYLNADEPAKLLISCVSIMDCPYAWDGHNSKAVMMKYLEDVSNFRVNLLGDRHAAYYGKNYLLYARYHWQKILMCFALNVPECINLQVLLNIAKEDINSTNQLCSREAIRLIKRIKNKQKLGHAVHPSIAEAAKSTLYEAIKPTPEATALIDSGASHAVLKILLEQTPLMMTLPLLDYIGGSCSLELLYAIRGLNPNRWLNEEVACDERFTFSEQTFTRFASNLPANYALFCWMIQRGLAQGYSITFDSEEHLLQLAKYFNDSCRLPQTSDEVPMETLFNCVVDHIDWSRANVLFEAIDKEFQQKIATIAFEQNRDAVFTCMEDYWSQACDALKLKSKTMGSLLSLRRLRPSYQEPVVQEDEEAKCNTGKRKAGELANGEQPPAERQRVGKESNNVNVGKPPEQPDAAKGTKRPYPVAAGR
jgi:hypothetical protein